jgi:hypothetical protein
VNDAMRLSVVHELRSKTLNRIRQGVSLARFLQAANALSGGPKPSCLRVLSNPVSELQSVAIYPEP